MTAPVGVSCAEGLPRLVSCLDEIVALCDDLCAVLKRERDALTNGKDDALAVALTEKRDRLKRLGEAEDRRRRACLEVSEALGLGPVDAPLADVAVRLDEAGRTSLVHIKDRLFRSMKEVGALNQGNARLIRRAQHYNRHVMGLLSGGGPDTYGPDGGHRPGTGGVFHGRA
jgi:flagellar biosynthesis/type III secretory pathway chaperone